VKEAINNYMDDRLLVGAELGRVGDEE